MHGCLFNFVVVSVTLLSWKARGFFIVIYQLNTVLQKQLATVRTDILLDGIYFKALGNSQNRLEVIQFQKIY